MSLIDETVFVIIDATRKVFFKRYSITTTDEIASALQANKVSLLIPRFSHFIFLLKTTLIAKMSKTNI
jgi:hypothetical protein